ncbi:hypothetical protein ACFQPA_20280 [Halomarina halobia]|uniref:Uncharacterized protein n=1 Tax=Halomarina halobia TaxID=3033386 RepID=A0ABD6AFN7_9EURY|nr:hypothetical protein [Halomarina sp. PSR21]
MTGDEPVQHCEVATPIDLEGALSRAGIEHLEVDEQRTVVIYQTAILMLIVTEGEPTATQRFDVELWKEPADAPDHDPEDLLSTFLDELLAATNIPCQCGASKSSQPHDR